jgi:hypothetical protein
MQFLAHLPLGAAAIAVFFCQNDPGMCDDWSATSGANRAYVLAGELVPVTAPAAGEVLLDTVTGLKVEPESASAESRALGRLGGEPEWIQDDETPGCPSCSTPMTFLAELEEGHDWATKANFGGGGRGYVFSCGPCAEATFLWQC